MTLARRLQYLAPLFLASRLCGQTDAGELRVTVTDAAGLPVEASVELISEVNQYRRAFSSGPEGRVTAKRLPYGLYRLHVTRQSFAPFSDLLEIRSSIPKEVKVLLLVAPLQETVEVTDAATLVDPHRTGTVNRIGGDTLENRRTTLPGRALAELVNQEPGWLFEANGILHPRGSEYQVQYVMDGIPLTDNRSPAFVPDFDINDVNSMSVMTANYPAEFGRKLGGVIEVVTARDNRQGFHGKAVGFGGSFETAGGYVEEQYGWSRNTLTLSAAGSSTNRFLDAPVEQNYTNHGTTGDFMAHFERDLGDKDRIGVIFRREQSRFLVPNELIQQAAGQRQDRHGFETAGQVSYTHIFSPHVLADLRGMVRDVSADLWSNPFSTPMIADQDRSFREGYFKGSVSAHYGIQEWKAGVETDFASVRESLNYQVTNPDDFDPDTPPTFQFSRRAPDREQAVFLQDLVRLHNFTLSAGLRFDHYGFLVRENAWSPRFGAAWYWPAAGIVFRASYDRVFQTPAFENILVASSPEVASLSEQVLRLPVRPSRGNFYEAGFAKSVFGKLRMDANFFHRDFTNYADDDLLFNTGVSFPIAFRKAAIYGVEVKLEAPRWGPLSGFVSYSNMRGTGYLPVTGGLFLGEEAADAIGETTGTFPISQDQRNTVKTRFRYQIAPRVWAAIGASYGSGLPVEFEGDQDDAIAQYGQRIVDRVNFERGRTRPGFAIDASAGVILFRHEKRSVRFQADMLNLTNQLNVIDFSGLFSGTALAAPRSVQCRLQVDF